MWFFSTGKVLRWRLILENYGPDIEYIQGGKSIATDTLSIFPINGNQKTTHEYTYKRENVSEINDTEELPEGNFPINLKLIYLYQPIDTSLMAKYTSGAYQKGYFCWGSNINLNLIICEVKIVIPSIIQSYVLHW